MILHMLWTSSWLLGCREKHENFYRIRIHFVSEAIVFYHLACCWRQSHIKVQRQRPRWRCPDLTRSLCTSDSLTSKAQGHGKKTPSLHSLFFSSTGNHLHLSPAWPFGILLTKSLIRRAVVSLHLRPQLLRQRHMQYWATLRVCAAIRSLKQRAMHNSSDR